MKAVKKIAILFALSLILALSMVACADAEVESITIHTQPNLTYYKGQQLDLSMGKLSVNIKGRSPEVVSMELASHEGYDSSVIGSQDVTLTYKEKSTKITVSVLDISSIRLKTPPTVTTYAVGQSFNPLGGVLEVTLVNNSVKEVPLSDPAVSVGFNSTIVGTRTFLISFGGKTTSISMKIVAVPSLVSIVKLPSKVSYYKGEPINLSGASVSVTTGGAAVTVSLPDTAGYVTNYDSSKLGSQTVTLNYLGLTQTFTVTVKEVKSIGILKDPTQTEYRFSDELNLAGGEIEVTDQNGGIENISMDDERIEVTDFERSGEAGERGVVLTFYGESDTLIITVVTSSINSLLSEHMGVMSAVSVNWERERIPTIDETLAEKVKLGFNEFLNLSTPDKNDNRIKAVLQTIVTAAISVDYSNMYKILNSNNVLGFNIKTKTLERTSWFYTEGITAVRPFTYNQIAEIESNFAQFAALNTKLQADYRSLVAVEIANSSYTVGDLLSYSATLVSQFNTEFLSPIKDAASFYTGFDVIPLDILTADKVTSITDFSTTIEAAYAKVKGILTSSSTASFILHIIDFWRSDYVEIIYEYYYRTSPKPGIYTNQVILDLLENSIFWPQDYIDLFNACTIVFDAEDTKNAAAKLIACHEISVITKRIQSGAISSLKAIYEQLSVVDLEYDSKGDLVPIEYDENGTPINSPAKGLSAIAEGYIADVNGDRDLTYLPTLNFAGDYASQYNSMRQVVSQKIISEDIQNYTIEEFDEFFDVYLTSAYGELFNAKTGVHTYVASTEQFRINLDYLYNKFYEMPNEIKNILKGASGGDLHVYYEISLWDYGWYMLVDDDAYFAFVHMLLGVTSASAETAYVRYITAVNPSEYQSDLDLFLIEMYGAITSLQRSSDTSTFMAIFGAQYIEYYNIFMKYYVGSELAKDKLKQVSNLFQAAYSATVYSNDEFKAAFKAYKDHFDSMAQVDQDAYIQGLANLYKKALQEMQDRYDSLVD